MRRLVQCFLVGLAFVCSWVQALERVSPETLDLSPAQLKIIRAELERRAISKEMPGAVFLVRAMEKLVRLRLSAYKIRRKGCECVKILSFVSLQ